MNVAGQFEIKPPHAESKILDGDMKRMVSTLQISPPVAQKEKIKKEDITNKMVSLLEMNTLSAQKKYVAELIKKETEIQVIKGIISFTENSMFSATIAMELILSIKQYEGNSILDDTNDYLAVVLKSLDQKKEINQLVSIIKDIDLEPTLFAKYSMSISNIKECLACDERDKINLVLKEELKKYWIA